MDFSKFKKSRSKLTEAVEKMKAQKPSYADDRVWDLTVDKAKNGEAIIRFLPQRDPEAPLAVLWYHHSINKNGKWLWENCPSTLGKDCPMCEYAQPFWDENTEASKAKASKLSRKKNFIANILVVKDPAKPENNGKVFLFRFGVKIYDKLLNAVAPESELEEAKMVHDLWDGNNFLLQCKEVSTYKNYDTSKFYDAKTPVAKTDEEIEVIFNQIYDLSEFTDEKKFKSYEEIQKKFEAFMKVGGGNKPAQTNVSSDTKFDFNEELKDDKEEVKEEKKETKKEKSESTETKKEEKVDDDFNFDGDEDFNFDFEE